MEALSAIVLCLALESMSAKGSKYELSPKNLKIACENTQQLITSAESYGINPFIIAAIVWNESRWDANAFDGSCCGIGQINPSFVPETCSQLKDPKISLQAIPRILLKWREQSPKNTADKDVYMIACYAAGSVCTKSSKAVKHAQRILKIAELYKTAYQTAASKDTK
jgi:hypothetical protein